MYSGWPQREADAPTAGQSLRKNHGLFKKSFQSDWTLLSLLREMTRKY
jgi:hypothetical protein